MFRKCICRKEAILLLLVLCQMRLPPVHCQVSVTPCPSHLRRAADCLWLGTAHPSLHILFKYTVFQIRFIFPLLLTSLIVHLADSHAFYGATIQLNCWEQKIFLSLISTSTASSHSSDTGTRKHGDAVSKALPCPDTEVMWWKYGRALWKK